ncbi:MAG TPA: sigma-E processing peptidase SpoIIGA [Eubacteriales bacterium]|nr:sigma-E processing peptidase SpoIIGA [Eubacteriales bacterium]
MEIYIEYVVIDNMAINSLLLWSAALTARIKVKWWKIMLAAAVGTGLACVMPFIAVSSLLLAGIKILIAPLLTFLAYSPVNVKKLVWSTLIFTAYTFVLGGIILAFIYMGVNMTLEKAAVYYSSSIPIGAYLTGLAAFGFLIFKLNEFIKSEKRLRQNIKKTVFTIDGKEITADGFIDSGNTLFADELPVCFVSNKKLITQLKNEIASATVNGEKIISGEYMTVAGSSAFYGIQKEIQVGEKIEKAVLTVSKAETSRYDIILNAVFMEENYENN